MNKPAREQILLTPQLVLTAGQQWWQNAGNTGGALSANPIFHHLGQQMLKGSVYSSVAGTLAIEFSPDGTNFPNSQTLTADPNNATSYPFSVDLDFPYFRFVVTDAGAGSTVQLQAAVFEESSGSTVLGGGSTTIVTVKDSPYTVLGFGQLTTLDATTAKTLAQIQGTAVPTGTTTILIQVGTGLPGDTSVPCLWRADGTAPTSSVGQTLLLGVGLPIPLAAASLANFKIIGTSAGTSTVRVTFMKQ